MAVDIDYDPFSEEAMSDPLPLYAELRRHHRAYRLDAYDAWALPRFEDVWVVLSDRESFSIIEGPIFQREALLNSLDGRRPEARLDPMPSFVEMDPRPHTDVRLAIGRNLRPHSVSRLEGFVRSRARARLDALVPRGRFDITAEYAGLVSAAVISHIVGLPEDEAPTVLDLVNRSLRRDPGLPGVSNAGLAARQVLIDRLVTLVAERRRLGAGDPMASIDRLIRAEVNGRRLGDREIAMQMASIMAGGTETVPKVVAGGMIELWRHSEQRSAVAGDPANCAPAFDEMVRYGGPLQWVGRTLLRDIELAGQAMRTGQRLVLLLASANRDEREFQDPDRFQWDRRATRHLGFGTGSHFCIGTHVARLEGRILVEELLARVPDYEIDVDDVLRPPSDFQVAYTRVPLVVP